MSPGQQRVLCPPLRGFPFILLRTAEAGCSVCMCILHTLTAARLHLCMHFCVLSAQRKAITKLPLPKYWAFNVSVNLSCLIIESRSSFFVCLNSSGVEAIGVCGASLTSYRCR